MALMMNGVKNASRKFHTQLLAVASAPCFARVRVGNVSPLRIQMPGAQVLAKPRMNMHAAPIISTPIPGLVDGSLAVPAAANTNSHADCYGPVRMRGKKTRGR